MSGSSTPQATVICTVRDGAKFLAPFVESVRAQTLADWELVVVDDGSRDGGLSMLRAVDDPRLKVFEATVQGRGHALNQAVASSSAPLIAIADVDDLSHPARLEHQLASFAADPEIRVLGTRVRVFFEGDDLTDWTGSTPAGDAAVVDVTAELRRGNPLVHSSLMVRADTLAEVGGYDADRTALFDYDLYRRLARAGVRLHRSESELVAKQAHRGQSFQARGQLGYRGQAARIQLDALRHLPGPARDWLTLPARVSAAFVPLHRRRALSGRRSRGLSSSAGRT